ncbi:salicylate hydroxylase [Catenuloplanes nepalensis]|uniref:Salicylate hydroxylase n=1 Tax=Catenuloplanes nepalensis TaxID=587533 RepID=A0ABT9MYA8_9ACTN|nr:FAD-dependent monooxygenase [Catenuloplanes nepalensis]MDP9796408.1 salicylate hydroxylase [Catenuloplanes nepalensis]
MQKPRIAVVGAGIGGLAAAAALARAGLRCDVFDRRDHPGLSGQGLGIQISPNGARALRDIGAVPHPDSAVRPDAVELRRWRDNSLIGRAPLHDAEARYGAPYYTLTRAELSGALLSAVDAGGGAGLFLGRRCVGAQVGRNGVRLHFADGGEHVADLVIGADGVHSALRGVLGGDGGLGPRFSGHVAYRAVIPADGLPAHLIRPHRVRVWLGPGRHCVAYPVRGGRMVNVVATAPSRSPEVPPERLLMGYAEWCGSVRALLSAAAGRGRVWPLHSGAPVPHRHRGGLVLLGDAAHPALPWMAQGASQALEDAVTLARCLGGPAPLERYDTLRGARAHRIATAVRAADAEHHLPDGLWQRRRDRRLATPPDRDWLYGYDPGAPS